MDSPESSPQRQARVGAITIALMTAARTSRTTEFSDILAELSTDEMRLVLCALLGMFGATLDFMERRNYLSVDFFLQEVGLRAINDSL